MAEDNAHPQGRVVRVIGPVVDVEFPPNELPDIYTALTVDITLGLNAPRESIALKPMVLVDPAGPATKAH